MSYEQLLDFQAKAGHVSRGYPDYLTNSIPQRKWAEDVGEEDRCMICLDDFDSSKVVQVLPSCGHVFCKSCLHQWFRLEKFCPICKERPF